MHIPHSGKPVSFFSLDVILSVGYRVNSRCGTQFRIWANRILKEHLIKGFTINERRLLRHPGVAVEYEPPESNVEVNFARSNLA